jgi:hypothetical protein
VLWLLVVTCFHEFLELVPVAQGLLGDVVLALAQLVELQEGERKNRENGEMG